MAEWNNETSAEGEYALGQAGKSAEPEDAATIRAEINETRERLSDTLSEIGERLNPHVVKEQVTERVKEGIREATIGRVEHMARSAADTVNSTRSGITATVRDNPVPAAMVAIGLAWMMFNGKRESSSDYSRRYNEFGDGDDTRSAGPYSRSSTFAGSYPYDRDYQETDAEGRVSRVVGDVRDRVSNTAHNVADSVKDRAGDLADRGRQLVDRGRDTAGNVASTVSSKARNVSHAVADRTSRGARRIEDTFYENPLAIGAVTVAVGVMAGLAVPRTDREVQLMGDARERVADKVRDVAHDATDKAKQVAGRVVDETKRVVKEEGVSLGGTQGTGAQAQNPS